jgi:hypothetical protein
VVSLKHRLVALKEQASEAQASGFASGGRITPPPKVAKMGGLATPQATPKTTTKRPATSPPVFPPVKRTTRAKKQIKYDELLSEDESEDEALAWKSAIDEEEEEDDYQESNEADDGDQEMEEFFNAALIAEESFGDEITEPEDRVDGLSDGGYVMVKRDAAPMTFAVEL